MNSEFLHRTWTDSPGQAVAQSRKFLGLTQHDLGAALGVRGNTVARWERGEQAPPYSVCLALAGMLKKST